MDGSMVALEAREFAVNRRVWVRLIAGFERSARSARVDEKAAVDLEALVARRLTCEHERDLVTAQQRAQLLATCKASPAARACVRRLVHEQHREAMTWRRFRVPQDLLEPGLPFIAPDRGANLTKGVDKDVDEGSDSDGVGVSELRV